MATILDSLCVMVCQNKSPDITLLSSFWPSFTTESSEDQRIAFPVSSKDLHLGSEVLEWTPKPHFRSKTSDFCAVVRV